MILAYTIPTEILPHLSIKLIVNLINCRTGLKQINSLNLKKTNYITFRARNKPIPSRDNLNVLIDCIKIKRLATTKFLGTYINEHLDCKPHISPVALKMAKSIGIINKVKHFITSPTRRILYCSLVLPYIQYCNIVWAKT